MLICDRDGKWSREVRECLSDGGMNVVQTPARAPNANAYAERFVRSVKAECLDRIIPIGPRHFRQTVAEYVPHDRHARNHQRLGNRLLDGRLSRREGRIRRRPRLGGVLKYYERAA